MNRDHPQQSEQARHVPVLLEPTVQALHVGSGDWVLDGTLGGGGHTAALLATGAKVVALDWDELAVRRAELQFAGAIQEGRLRVFWSGFGELGRVLESETQRRGQACAGVLLDVGFSSDQLDDPARGLSYLHDGPLDMRLDSRQSLTAAEIVNTWREEDLAEIFYKFGEEPKSRVLARKLVSVRKLKPLASTFGLRAVVEEVYPYKHPSKGRSKTMPHARRAHPTARIFQALRVAVNGELDQLAAALPAAAEALAEGGRLAVITFQPLEDRLVKEVFRNLAVVPEDAVGRTVGVAKFKVWPKLLPDEAELALNPRARSAKLRVLEKLGPLTQQRANQRANRPAKRSAKDDGGRAQ